MAPRERDDTPTCEGKVPPTYRVIKRIGPPDSLSGAVFLVISDAVCSASQQHQDAAVLRPHIRVVKVPNGATISQGEIDDTSENITRYEAISARNLKTLPPHLQFVAFHDIAEPTASPYLVMDAVRGPSLSDFYRDRNRASVAFVWHVSYQIASAILWLHHGVTPDRPDDPRQLMASCHRDIKGANLMFDYTNRSAVGNFPNTLLVDLGSGVFRPLGNPSNENPPSRDDITLDLLGLASMTHALAHDQNPSRPWDGICGCNNVPQTGLDGTFCADDRRLVWMWELLVQEQVEDDAADEDKRKKDLILWLKTAAYYRDRALAREQRYINLASDAAILEVANRVSSNANSTATGAVPVMQTTTEGNNTTASAGDAHQQAAVDANNAPAQLPHQAQPGPNHDPTQQQPQPQLQAQQQPQPQAPTYASIVTQLDTILPGREINAKAVEKFMKKRKIAFIGPLQPPVQARKRPKHWKELYAPDHYLRQIFAANNVPQYPQVQANQPVAGNQPAAGRQPVNHRPYTRSMR